MGDGQYTPLNREDVLRLIQENGGTAKGLDLSKKEFEEGIDLHGFKLFEIILNEAALERAHLEGASLIGAHLEGAFLNEAHLEAANLSHAHLENADLSQAYLEKARLTGSHLEGAGLSYAHLEGADLADAFLDRTRLSGAYLQGTKMFGVKITPDTEMDSVNWGNCILGEEEEGERTRQLHFFKWAADTYRRLKIWYTNSGMYDVAGEFFYREREANRKYKYLQLLNAIKYDEAVYTSVSKIIWPFCWLWILRLSCGYGERPKRVVISAIVVISGLAIAYSFPGSFESQSAWDSLYYSFVSFTALGYGGWAPKPIGWVTWAGVVESFIGVFMMALFLVTFTRKMTR